MQLGMNVQIPTNLSKDNNPTKTLQKAALDNNYEIILI